jgi:hypothetical protein
VSISEGGNREIQKAPLKEYTAEDYVKLVDSKQWPTPRWIIEDKTPKREIQEILFGRHFKYEDYFASKLRSRYMELEADFRTTYPDYLVDVLDEDERKHLPCTMSISEYIVLLLQMARTTLEKDKFDKQAILVATNLLDLAEECIVWIISPEQALSQITTLIARLDLVKPDNFEEYKQKLEDIKNKIINLNETKEKLHVKRSENHYQINDGEKLRTEIHAILENYRDNAMPENVREEVTNKLVILEDKQHQIFKSKNEIESYEELIDAITDIYHSVFDEIIWVCNQKRLDEIIDISLQIERLITLRFLGIFFFMGFLFISPLLFNSGNLYNALFGHDITDVIPYLTILRWILGIAIVGAAGGFLSGLLQVRESKTTLTLYEESVVLVQLRPIFGAFAAILLSMFLSWGILENVLQQNFGSYLLVAFLSGFSERYFLNLLKINPESKQVELTPMKSH